jgi:hypothetical protein
MSEIKVNKLSPRTNCGTVQLGDSGDTITIPAGVTITNSGTAAGFGATGAASWDTTVKTSGFTAVSGVGYFVNTTAGAISVNLPAGVAGAVVAIKDYANTFDTNAVTLVQNGSDKIGGDTVNATLDTEGIAVTLVFVDSTQGWLVTDSGLQSESPTTLYVTATGGTITCSGDYRIHTFTGPGTLCVSCAGNAQGSNTVDYLVVAGGGGGGASVAGYYAGGGGGAGGFRESVPSPAAWTASPIANPGNARPVTATSFPITVGGGGAGGAGPGSCSGVQGSNSIFSDIISTGGGYGGKTTGIPGNGVAGGPGGSGGGGGAKFAPGANIGGTGNTPPVSPAQGFNGGNGSTNTSGVGGGGGGALGVGDTGTCQPYGQVGGPGATTCISGSPLTKAVGGATGCQPGGTPTTAANSGNGGQSGGQCATTGAAGGSGIVIIRYKFQN